MLDHVTGQRAFGDAVQWRHQRAGEGDDAEYEASGMKRVHVGLFCHSDYIDDYDEPEFDGEDARVHHRLARITAMITPS